MRIIVEENYGSPMDNNGDHGFCDTEGNDGCDNIYAIKFDSQDKDVCSNKISENISVENINNNPEKANGMVDLHKENDEDDVFIETNGSAENANIKATPHHKINNVESIVCIETKTENQDHEMPRSDDTVTSNNLEDECMQEFSKSSLIAVNTPPNLRVAKILSNILLSTPVDLAINDLPTNLEDSRKQHSECEKKISMEKLNTSEELIILLQCEDLYKLQEKQRCISKTQASKKPKWHRWSSNQVKSFWCKMCRFTSTDKFSLWTHMAANHKEEAGKKITFIEFAIPGKDPTSVLYRCTDCTYTTEHKHSFKSHLLRHKRLDEVEVFRCNECSFVTKRKHGLIKHVWVHKWGDQVEVSQCPYCSFKTKRECYLEVHIRMIHKADEVELLDCKICGFKTKYKESLKKHMLLHTDSRKLYQCPVCPHTTCHKQALRSHIVTHQDDEDMRIYHCAHCDYKAKFKGNLRKHLMTHRSSDKIEMHKCDHCSFQSKHKDYMEFHRRLHLVTDKLYPCRLCPYRGKSTRHLTLHLRTHMKPDEGRKYKCHQCPYQSRNQANVTRHAVIHSKPEEITWWPCDKCNYRAKSKDRLRTHFNVVHTKAEDGRWYACKHCEFQTRSLGNLKRHSECHMNRSEANQFQCEHCPFSSSTSAQVARHVKAHHKKNKQKKLRARICN